MAKKKPDDKMGWKQDRAFRGNASEMRDSPFLASEDIECKTIPGQEPGTVTLPIADIRQAKDLTFEKGRKVERGFLLKFPKARKALVLNATNRKTLQKAYGNDVTWWIGKRIKLYVRDDVQLRGELTKGIRIEPVDPPSRPPEGWKLPDDWQPGDPLPDAHGNTAPGVPAPNDQAGDPEDPDDPLNPDVSFNPDQGGSHEQ